MLITSRSRPHDARAALAGDVVAAGDVDDEHPEIGEIAGEGGGQVVAAAFQQDQFEAGKPPFQVVGGLDVQRRVLADHGVGAGAGFHRRDAGGIDKAGAADAFGVLGGDKVVGDDGEVDAALLQGGDQAFEQGGLAGADRSADADARGCRTRWPGSRGIRIGLLPGRSSQQVPA